MEPTARAIQIDGPIGAALEQVHLAFDHEFDPASLEQQFKIGLVNFGGMFILSALMQNLEMEAPKVQIAIEHMSEQLARDALNSADIDIAIGVLPDSRRNWSLQTLARDRSVLIARRDHPTIRDRISLADLAAARHVHVPICSPIDRTLARHGVRLHYAISSANPLIAPYIVGRTDLLAIVPENIARPSAEMFGLSIFEPPIKLPDYSIQLVNHRRYDAEPAHQWLIRCIASAAVEITKELVGQGPITVVSRGTESASPHRLQ